jgi:hypothetical protein
VPGFGAVTAGVTEAAEPPLSAVAQLEREVGEVWKNISIAHDEAEKQRLQLDALLQAGRLVPADTAIVGFGSLARREWTQGSDFDWTLLVDGQVSSDHLEVARNIRGLVKELGLKGPGPTGVFGGLAFSHDIVHLIGGDSDTNKNTTRRILLLLESLNLGSGAMVRERVIRSLFRRYVGEDLRYQISEAPKSIPRFLLNDIVRYWRTMAVDFAGKRRERDEGWALRNVKLRMSRKLLFASGLWVCLSCQLDPSPELKRSVSDPQDHDDELTRYLTQASNRRPLESLARVFLRYAPSGALSSAKVVFGAYERFLALLNDAGKRAELDGLDLAAASKNQAFKDAKAIASDFQRGLGDLFFRTDDELTRAVQLYGVF